MKLVGMQLVKTPSTFIVTVRADRRWLHGGRRSHPVPLAAACHLLLLLPPLLDEAIPLSSACSRSVQLLLPAERESPPATMQTRTRLLYLLLWFG